MVFDEEDLGLLDWWLFNVAEAWHDIDDDSEDDDDDIDDGEVCIGIPFVVPANPDAEIVTEPVGDIAEFDDVPLTAAAVTPLITAASCEETLFDSCEFPLWWSECLPFTVVAVNGLIVWWTFKNFLSVTFILTNCWFSVCYCLSNLLCS